MNVRQLREALEALPDDLLVVIPGRDGGLDEVDGFDRFHVRPSDADSYWYGRLEIAPNGVLAVELLARSTDV